MRFFGSAGSVIIMTPIDSLKYRLFFIIYRFKTRKSRSSERKFLISKVPIVSRRCSVHSVIWTNRVSPQHNKFHSFDMQGSLFSPIVVALAFRHGRDCIQVHPLHPKCALSTGRKCRNRPGRRPFFDTPNTDRIPTVSPFFAISQCFSPSLVNRKTRTSGQRRVAIPFFRLNPWFLIDPSDSLS